MPVASAATVANHGANSSAKSRKRHERRIVKDVTSGHWRGQQARGTGNGERDIDHASHAFRDDPKCYDRGEQITVPRSPFLILRTAAEAHCLTTHTNVLGNPTRGGRRHRWRIRKLVTADVWHRESIWR